MLTGPATMLKWSFGRADETDEVVRQQIAFALRDEVADLDASGVRIIQIDEPALREALPLRVADQPAYLSSATTAFRTAGGAAGEMTQIHSHMCYAEFGDVLSALRDFDADVLLVELARAGMGMLGDLAAANPLGAIGPGVYDIHSPRVPTADEMAELLRGACAAMPAQRIWVTPDCGLKTRRYEEIVPALGGLCAASRTVRAEIGAEDREAVARA
jgi:5-methyltetrahydropteroyltriglutamate--homocysteine methyltransferase